MPVATNFPKSKIIQLLQFGTPRRREFDNDILLALCSDGTIWEGVFRYEAGRPPAMLWQRMFAPETENEGVE